MKALQRIVHWHDEDNQMWRAGLLAAGRNRLHSLTDAQRALLVLGAFLVAGFAVALAR